MARSATKQEAHVIDLMVELRRSLTGESEQRPAPTEPCECFSCKLAEQERRALPGLEDA